jgi:hypothetical protein
MREGGLHIAGVIMTVAVHAVLASAMVRSSGCAIAGRDPQKPPGFDDAEVIEASLAYRSAAKKRQPQKKKNPMVAPPDVVGVSHDADKVPVPPDPDKPDKPPPPEFIDPKATFNKARDIDLDEAPTESGQDDSHEEGSADGSEWGTSADARGDPYVGELKGRIPWEMPTLERGSGVTWGCVRLAPDGKIVDRELREKSGNANLDRSVEEALRNASDMEQPVPEHLAVLLTEKGICFRFNLE